MPDTSATSADKLRLTLPTEGQVLKNRYRVDRRINGGTYGVVFGATDLKASADDESRVAVKALLPSAAKSHAVVRRFEREVQVIRALTHPNLISILDYGLDPEGCLFYVMDFLEGEDLGARLQRGLLPVRGAALVAIQVLMALEEAHEHEIVHRDLKPENIFLQTAGGRIRVRVLDFGIAKVIGERGQSMEKLTLTNEACGTPNYMAPEQITGEAIGPWTDVYALGLILYEMITGEMAVQGSSFIETLRKQASEPIPVPDQLIGTPIGRVLARALKKAPTERFPSAGAMQTALKEAVAG